jgi:hypothetical protein
VTSENTESMYCPLIELWKDLRHGLPTACLSSSGHQDYYSHLGLQFANRVLDTLENGVTWVSLDAYRCPVHLETIGSIQ